MKDDSILREVMDDHSISVKQLAAMSGRALTTIYGYGHGRLTVPSDVWRVLFQATRDIDGKVVEVERSGEDKASWDNAESFARKRRHLDDTSRP